MDIASQPRPHILIPHIYDRPHSPPSLTHTSGSSDHSDDAAARTYLMTPQSAITRDYGDVYDPRGRAPLIPKTGDDFIYPEPKTPTRSGYPIRDMASPVSAPATPVGKEKRKSKRFTLSFGRDRAPPPSVPDVPPLPTLEKLETEKRKSKRLSISRSLQNLKERAQADKARRRASSLSGSKAPPVQSDLPPVPAIPSMYKSMAAPVEPPTPRNRRRERREDPEYTSFSNAEQPQPSNFKKFMRRMTLTKPPKQYPSEPASTSVPRTPVPPAPKVAAAIPFVADKPSHSSSPFSSLGRKRSKKRGSLVPQVQPPKSVKGVLAEMSESSVQVQRRATHRRSQMQRIPVPTWAAQDEPEPLIMGDELPAPLQVEVNANDESATRARADALARLMGTQAAPSPSAADLDALPPLNLPLTGPLIGSTKRDTQHIEEDTPAASMRVRAPVPPLRTNSPRSMSTPKPADPVTPPPEAMDVFTPPSPIPPLPVEAEQLAKALSAPVSKRAVAPPSSRGNSVKRKPVVAATPAEQLVVRSLGRSTAAPSSYRDIPDFSAPPTPAVAPSYGTAPYLRSESPEPMSSAAFVQSGFPLPPGAGPPVSNGANLTDAAALAASYRSRTATPDKMRPVRSIARDASLPTRKLTGPIPGMRSATGPATYGASRSDLGHGTSTPEPDRVALPSELHAASLNRNASLPTRSKASTQGARSVTGPAAFGASRSDLGHDTGADEHGWPVASASESGHHQAIRHARSQPMLRNVPSHRSLRPPVPSKSLLRTPTPEQQAALFKAFNEPLHGRQAMSDLGHGAAPRKQRKQPDYSLFPDSDDEYDHLSADHSHDHSTIHGSIDHSLDHYLASSLSHSTTHETFQSFSSPLKNRNRFAGSPAPYEAPIGDGLSPAMSLDGHGPKRFRSISRTLSKKKQPPTSHDAYEAKQRELLSRRKSCKPLIHSQASIAAELSNVGDKEDARVMEACFMS